MFVRALSIACLGLALLLGACGAPEQTASIAGLPARSTALPAARIQATTPAILPTADISAPGALETAIAGPEAATAIALMATAEAEAGALLPLSADDLVFTFDATNVKSYSWTILRAPAAANDVEGTIIKQGSGQQIALDISQVEQYFTVPGAYTLRLTIVDKQDQVDVRDFELLQ